MENLEKTNDKKIQDSSIKQILLEYLPLFLLIITILVLINPSFFQNTLDSQSPNSFLAGDTYAHLAYINDVIEKGNYNHESQFYIGFTGDQLSPREPPLMLFYVTFLSNLLNIKSHVATLFGLLLGIILSICTIYFLIKKVNPNWALLFLPCTLFLFTHPFIAGITWGFWKAYFMYFILITSLIFFITKLNTKKVMVLALMVSSIILASPALLPYIIIIFTIKLIIEKNKFKENIKHLAISGILITIITLHYFLNYFVARTKTDDNAILNMLGVQKGYELYGANVYISHFSIFWYIALVGFIYGIIYIIQKYNEIETIKYKLIILSSIFFIIFLLPLIGVTRIYQFRLVWPLFISIFVGLTLYIIINNVIKKLKINLKIGITIITLILTLIIGLSLLNTLNFQKNNFSITTTQLWDGYQYIHFETPKNSTLLVVDPLLTQNSVILTANRKVYYYDNEKFKKAIEENKNITQYPPTFYCDVPERSRNGFTVYSNKKLNDNCLNERNKQHKPCEFNYILINKQFSNENQLDILKKFLMELNQNNVEKIKEGAQIIILKNNNLCKL